MFEQRVGDRGPAIVRLASVAQFDSGESGGCKIFAIMV